MTLKKTIFIVSILLGIGALGALLMHREDHSGDQVASPPDVVSKQRTLPMHPTRIATKAKPGEDRTLLHPLADPEKRAAYAAQTPSSWKEWAKALTEIRLGWSVENGFLSTSKEIDLQRPGDYSYLLDQAKRYEKKKYPIPTPVTEMPHLDKPVYYEGPQTTEAIMTEFDDRYDNSFPRAAEMEEIYPRAVFLQRLLDKGAVVKKVSDYEYYMKLRGELLYRKDRPEDWHSGNHGIPITTDFAEYEEGFLDRKVWENSIIQQVSEENPETGQISTGDR